MAAEPDWNAIVNEGIEKDGLDVDKMCDRLWETIKSQGKELEERIRDREETPDENDEVSSVCAI